MPHIALVTVLLACSVAVSAAEQPVSNTVTKVGSGKTTPGGTAAESNWPGWRGPTHDDRSPLKGIRKDWSGGLRKVWEVEGLSAGTCTWSVPAIVGNRLVVTGRHGQRDEVSCFDADKGGAKLWTVGVEGGEAGHFHWGSGPHATPAISGDKVYTVNLAGSLQCLSMADGKTIWKRELGGPMYSFSPLIYGDLLIVHDAVQYWGGTHLTALKKDTGEVAWRYEHALSFCGSSPVLAKIDGKEQIICWTSLLAFAVEPATGKELWKFSNPEMIKAHQAYQAPIASPAIVGNSVLSGWTTLLQIEKGVPKELWAGPKGGKEAQFSNRLSEPIVLDGYLYEFGGYDGLTSAPGSMLCADVKTGEVKWTERIGNGSMVYVDGCLLCLTYSGDLVLVEPHPEGFKKLAEMKGLITCVPWQAAEESKHYGNAPCWASPAVARGKVYIHYSDRLVCYDLMK